MNGIASSLDPVASVSVESLWQVLEHECGLVGVKITPFPHFTWQVADGYDLPRLEIMLHGLARQTRPFTVRSAGLGLFTGESPIVYIPLVKDEYLLRFHAKLWKLTDGIASTPHPYYAPDKWVPHITLAYGDVSAQNLDCVMQALAFRSFEWEIRVDNLAFMAQPDDGPTTSCHYRFGKP